MSHTAIVITGPVGAGKSITAAALRELLGRAGRANVLFDMDHLRAVYPIPFGDTHAVNLGYRVLADAWRQVQASDFGDAGPLDLAILADVVESRAQRAEYERALPDTDVVIVRLKVDIPELVRRLNIRESADIVEWYRFRAAELDEIMEREKVGDLVIEVTDHAPEALARIIAERLSLFPQVSPTGTAPS